MSPSFEFSTVLDELGAASQQTLRPGQMSLVVARAGVGKSRLLTQMGLDLAVRSHDVMHLSLGHDLTHVESEYDVLLEDRLRHGAFEDAELTALHMRRHRVIQVFAGHRLSGEQLDRAIALYADNMRFRPSLILIDGYDWQGDVVERAAELGAFQTIARRLQAQLWLSGQSHREQHAEDPDALMPPFSAFASLIEQAMYLHPEPDHVSVRLLKHGDGEPARETGMHLAQTTLRLLTSPPVKSAPVKKISLLSGGARGAEACFGEHAEKYGLAERTFTTPGRLPFRDRGVVVLDEEEQRQGDVADTYLREHLRQSLVQRPELRPVLQCIWHQVATAGQVFIIGQIKRDDGSVIGGTGWAAELAKHFGIPLFVFDQIAKSWHRWHEARWQPCDAPRITAARFAGSGTRKLNDAGLQAIADLFARSFAEQG